MTRRTVLTLAATIAVGVPLVAGSLAVLNRGEDDAAADDIKQILDPIAGAADATDAVALVNGAPISKYRLEGTIATSGESREKVLDALIEHELLHQEGVRLGLEATDDAVEKAIAQTRETASPALVEAAIELAREQGITMDEETYWSHPLTIEATRKSLTVGAAREALLAGVEPQRRDEVLAGKVQELRATAEIDIRAP
ncbi:MAG TPA: SurA N-terminal domain-containing protein [Tepidiformaceae bacterium]|nr:SurA N-terminal domain-containing protein [Tepidiformaceae bacterium]